jgi:hypothetical protein
MRSYLHMRHWQLFLLQIGPILLGYAYFFSRILSDISSSIPEPDAPAQQTVEPMLNMFGTPFALLLVALLMSFAILLSWLWSVGNHLHDRLPADTKLTLTWFRIAIIFVAAYLLILVYGLWAFINHLTNLARAPLTPDADPNDLGVMFAGMMIMMIFGNIIYIVCMFYCYYFIAKSLKSVEYNREALIGEYIGEFFLIWFFPIGVWFLQPKINRIFESTEPPLATNSGVLDEGA